jgi:hypothetical protein
MRRPAHAAMPIDRDALLLVSTLLQPYAPVALLPAWSARLLGMRRPARAAMPVDADALMPVFLCALQHWPFGENLPILGKILPSTSVTQKGGKEPLGRTNGRPARKVLASSRARPNVPSLYKLAK